MLNKNNCVKSNHNTKNIPFPSSSKTSPDKTSPSQSAQSNDLEKLLNKVSPQQMTIGGLLLYQVYQTQKNPKINRADQEKASTILKKKLQEIATIMEGEDFKILLKESNLNDTISYNNKKIDILSEKLNSINNTTIESFNKSLRERALKNPSLQKKLNEEQIIKEQLINKLKIIEEEYEKYTKENTDLKNKLEQAQQKGQLSDDVVNELQKKGNELTKEDIANAIRQAQEEADKKLKQQQDNNKKTLDEMQENHKNALEQTRAETKNLQEKLTKEKEDAVKEKQNEIDELKRKAEGKGVNKDSVKQDVLKEHYDQNEFLLLQGLKEKLKDIYGKTDVRFFSMSDTKTRQKEQRLQSLKDAIGKYNETAPEDKKIELVNTKKKGSDNIDLNPSDFNFGFKRQKTEEYYFPNLHTDKDFKDMKNNPGWIKKDDQKGLTNDGKITLDGNLKIIKKSAGKEGEDIVYNLIHE
jgi:hypothetical protein